jgi:hypothetical protein
VNSTREVLHVRDDPLLASAAARAARPIPRLRTLQSLLVRAVYFMLNNNQDFDDERFYART